MSEKKNVAEYTRTIPNEVSGAGLEQQIEAVRELAEAKGCEAETGLWQQAYTENK